jgi:oxalate decarboxylase/phosphoglucose isomerase-like protein (cupin superfamily)
MTVVPIQLDPKRDRRGVILPLELYKEFGLSVLDVVVSTTKKGEKRGGHYHPRESGKVELFIPLVGTAKLLWHDRATPQRAHEELMCSLFQNGTVVYRVDSETCHQVTGESESEFMMLELSSTVYSGKRDPECEHGLKVSR